MVHPRDPVRSVLGALLALGACLCVSSALAAAEGLAAPEPAFRSGELERLWTDLMSEDAAQAYRAIWVLAAAPQQAAPFLQKRLQAAVPADPQRVAQLLRDLDSDRFAVREKAAAELEDLGELAEPMLRQATKEQTSAEVRQQLERLLERIELQVPSRERLRALRALEALEQMDTPEARQVLERLARGTPEARLTQEAKDSLQRLRQRSSGKP